MTEIPDELSDDRLCLLRSMAEFSTHDGTALSTVSPSDITEHMKYVFDALLHLLPEIPSSDVKSKVTNLLPLLLMVSE